MFQSDSNSFRRCSKCGEEYPLTSDFWYKRDYGFRTDCKKCCKERCYNYQKKNQAKISEYGREWRLAHPDKMSEYIQRWDKVNSYKRREWVRRWNKANPDKMRKIRHRWCSNNQDKAREYTQRRRSVKRNLPYIWDNEYERAMFEAWNYCCAYCGKPSDHLQADHYIPLKSGGKSIGTVPYNMIPACRSCNTSKNNTMPHEWLDRKFGVYRSFQISDKIETYLFSMRLICDSNIH